MPLNWEMLSLVGGVCATSAGAGWKVCQMLGKMHLRELEAKLAFHTHLTETQSNEVRKHKLATDDLEKCNGRLQQLNEKLAADLEEGLSKEAFRTIEELKFRVTNFDQLRHALLGDEDEVWKLRGTVAPPNFVERMRLSRCKVLTVINYKGGVGKTTIVAGLAAYLAKHGKRVLIVDFDYQGSLTRMMILGARLTLGSSIRADALIAGDISGKELVHDWP